MHSRGSLRVEERGCRVHQLPAARFHAAAQSTLPRCFTFETYSSSWTQPSHRGAHHHCLSLLSLLATHCATAADRWATLISLTASSSPPIAYT